ncbi:MAG: M17 family metallopeptidase [Alphaproteobacteria bacterium]
MKPALPLITKKTGALPIYLTHTNQYAAWIKSRPTSWQRWLKENKFEATPGNFSVLPDNTGGIAAVLCITETTLDTWSIAQLAERLPSHTYQLSGQLNKKDATQLALGWSLACYQYTRYRSSARPFAKLVVPQGCDLAYVKAMSESINWARDMINTPPNDMNTAALAAEAQKWAKAAGATVRVIKGKDLLKENYPLLYTVGQASEHPPHLVDMRFTRKGAPKVTLVGKGICFDSGGLDIKSSSGMRLMKKDMGGAACVLALARALVAADMPIQLRVLLPIAENSVSGNAMRPSDVVKSRKGTHVEIGNTDAEGRLILCDALYEADQEKPDLIIDCATLTGAARVALGTGVPAFFTPDDALAKSVEKTCAAAHDPLWRLPLHAAYRPLMDSSIADISNDAASGYGGAITAALYLKEFVTNTHAWMHIDMMAWNLSPLPGRPVGGEAMGVRALYELVNERYGK